MITIICYNEIKRYPESKRQELINEFLEGMLCCEGSERERYTNIYLGLIEGRNIISDSY